MKARDLVLPSLALGAAALLIAPLEESYGFSKLGGSLDTEQRDFRVFNNFEDPSANSNTTPHPMFPGWVGAEMAIWKGYVEWGSIAHGDGSGDPTQPNLGDGGANFDPAWMGAAAGVGGIDDNIVSALHSCGGGLLAFTETPSSDGWRIRLCEEATWFGGPGIPGSGELDMQGVLAHEFGHALGLGHSGSFGATMAASIGSGTVAARSINNDDKLGVQCVYGVIDPSKPTICSTAVSGTTITLTGVNFDPLDNTVWFTNENVTATSADPRVRAFNVPSSGGGTSIGLPIPADAGPGDVLVQVPGGQTGETLSNAFPSDLARTITNGTTSCGPFAIASISPNPVPALSPGTAQDVTVTGSQLGSVTSVDLNLTPIPGGSWTIVDPSTITIDLPQSPLLGSNQLTLTTVGGGAQRTASFDIVASTTPVLQVGNGDPLNVVTPASGLDITASGEEGELHWVFFSRSNLPSVHPKLCLLIGNGFFDLDLWRVYTIPEQGWTAQHVSFSYSGPLQVLYLQSVDFGSGATPKLGVSNLQSITLSP